MTIGKQLSDLNPDGTSLGQSTADLISFHGVTPVSQRASASQAAVTTTGSASTTANSGTFGYASATQADAIVTLVNELRAALVAKGIIKGSA